MFNTLKTEKKFQKKISNIENTLGFTINEMIFIIIKVLVMMVVVSCYTLKNIFRYPLKYVPPHRNLGSFIYMKKDNEEIKTPGFFVNLDWNKTIQKLTNEEAGQLLKNMCNYALDHPLIETSDTVETMCDMGVFKTIEINKNKYIDKCIANAANGLLGGRPKGSKNKNPEKPNGLFENPEEAKHKDNNKVKDRGKDIDIEKDKTRARLEIDKMKKLVEIDLEKIKDDAEYNFIIKVRELVKRLSWARYELLIFSTRIEDVENLLIEFNELGCFQGVLDIKEHYPYFLNSIIK